MDTGTDTLADNNYLYIYFLFKRFLGLLLFIILAIFIEILEVWVETMCDIYIYFFLVSTYMAKFKKKCKSYSTQNSLYKEYIYNGQRPCSVDSTGAGPHRNT